MNFVVTMRAGLASLAAAAGIASPTEFERKHAVYRDALGRVIGADALFPSPVAGEDDAARVERAVRDALRVRGAA
jgi:hypothetical protein